MHIFSIYPLLICTYASDFYKREEEEDIFTNSYAY